MPARLSRFKFLITALWWATPSRSNARSIALPKGWMTLIVGEYFEGDKDNLLKLVQHDTYWYLVSVLFSTPRDEYLRHYSYVGVENDLARTTPDVWRIDHRVLQCAYGIIAAHYRQRHVLTLQLQLPYIDGNDSNYIRQLSVRWCTYFLTEVCDIAEDPFITDAILATVVYDGSDRGFFAQHRLAVLLNRRYGTWDGNDGCSCRTEGRYLPHRLVSTVQWITGQLEMSRFAYWLG